MSLRHFVVAQFVRAGAPWQKHRILKQAAPAQLTRADWNRSLEDPSEFYRDCYRFFHQRLAVEVREHRSYFRASRWGFGEDAMHVMWHALFQEFKPANFLEIGIYRGQCISLAALLSRRNDSVCQVEGISPFSPAGDSRSKYPNDIDYLADTLSHFAHFALPEPNLLKAYSTDPEALTFIRSKARDMVYVDGNHDYEVVLKDWEVCSESLKPGGIIVMDDSACGTSYRPPLFATAGHPGPSRVCREIDRSKFHEILQVGHNRVFQKIF